MVPQLRRESLQSTFDSLGREADGRDRRDCIGCQPRTIVEPENKQVPIGVWSCDQGGHDVLKFFHKNASFDKLMLRRGSHRVDGCRGIFRGFNSKRTAAFCGASCFEMVLSEISSKYFEITVDRVGMSGVKRLQNGFTIGAKFQIRFLKQFVDYLGSTFAPVASDLYDGANQQRLKPPKEFRPRGFVPGA